MTGIRFPTPWDRLLRTLDYVFLIVYGGPDALRYRAATAGHAPGVHRGA